MPWNHDHYSPAMSHLAAAIRDKAIAFGVAIGADSEWVVAAGLEEKGGMDIPPGVAYYPFMQGRPVYS